MVSHLHIVNTKISGTHASPNLLGYSIDTFQHRSSHILLYFDLLTIILKIVKGLGSVACCLYEVKLRSLNGILRIDVCVTDARI